MANRSLGSLTIDLIARTFGFEQGMDKAGRSFDKRVKEITKTAARVGAVVGAGFTAAGVAVAAWTRQTIEAAASVERLSALANSSTDTFQRWSAGARMVGIEQDKLADILKDTQDKVGDFIQTGGGAMADFFEQIAPRVGVTADEFRRLSGPDALQLYVSSLEKANLSQADMIFYMEAIASDSSLLLPLLRDNGEAMGQYGDEAEKLGAVMSGDLLNSAALAREELNRLSLVKEGLINRIVEGVLPALTGMTDKLVDTASKTDALDKVARIAVTGMKLLTSAGIIVGGVFKTVGEALGGVAATVAALMEGEFKRATEAFGQSRLDILANVAATVNAVQAVWDEVEIKGTPLADAARVDTRLAQGFVKDGGKKIVSEAEKAYKAVEEVIARIRRDIATFGMSEEQVQLFDLEAMGATADQLKSAADLLATRRMQIDDQAELEKQRKRDEERIQGFKEAMGYIEDERQLLRLSAADQEIWNRLKWAGVAAEESMGQEIIKATQELQRQRDAMDSQIEVMDSVRSAGKDLFVDFANGANPLQSLEDAWDRIHQKILGMIAERLMDQLFGQQGDPAGGSSGNWIGQAIGWMFGGGRAGGGMVSPRSFVEVNERGLEMATVRGRDYLLAGDAPVQVTPNHRLGMGGGTGVTVNFNGYGKPDRRTAQQASADMAVAAQSLLSRNGRGGRG